MAHTPRVQAVLAEAAALRARAAELSKAWADLRGGANGYVNEDMDNSHLYREADALVASVLIKVRQVSLFGGQLDACRAALKAKDDEEVRATATPRQLRALEEIRNYERTGRWSNGRVVI